MKLVAKSLLVLAIGIGFLQTPAVADLGDLLQTFPNPTPAAGDRLGYSVAAVGNNVLAGAHHDDTGATNAGAAYLFDSATGALLQTYQNPTPAYGDYFGYSVAAVGNNVLAGAYNDDTGATDAGAAYLFNGSTGALLQTYLNPTPADGDCFGNSVAAVGNNILVGAPGAGAVYLFGSTGAPLQTFYGDGFGVSVAFVGNNVLVGAPLDDTGATDAGAAYLFDGATGALLQTFQKPTPAVNDGFGNSVAALGNNVLVGAPNDDTGATNAGAAYLFDGATGALLLTFPNPFPGVNDHFSDVGAVAAVGEDVLIGAYCDDTGATDAGAAYLFDGATGALLWTFQKPTPAAGDSFGTSVAAVGNNVLVGAYYDDTGATDAGAVYLFEGVPEPATLLFVALGGLGVLLKRRARTRTG